MTESVLNNDDIPWEVLKRRGFESVRLMELTRFYLQLKEDPHGPNVALFVGNLPPNLTERQYETILLDYLDDGRHVFIWPGRYCQILAKHLIATFTNFHQPFLKWKLFRYYGSYSHLSCTFLFIENKFSSIGPIYYEYGSMVITFDSSNVAVIAYEILKNRLFDDKKLLGNRSVIKAQCTSS